MFAAFLSILLMGINRNKADGIWSGDTCVFPTDECFGGTSSSIDVSYQYECGGNNVMYSVWDNSECSGSAVADTTTTYYSCGDGDCDFALLTVSSCVTGCNDDSTGCDSDGVGDWATGPYILDQCSSTYMDGMDLYYTEVCSGDAITWVLYSDDACTEEYELNTTDTTTSTTTSTTSISCFSGLMYSLECEGGGGSSACVYTIVFASVIGFIFALFN